MSETIIIGGLLVSVYREPMEGEGEEFLFGTWSQGPVPTITVNSSCSEPVQARTFLHEVLEAINDLYGIRLQEEQIKAVETALADSVARNPSIAKALVESLARV